MGRRTREHTIKIFQLKDGEVINGEFTCTHHDHAMESIKDYGDYYIEVYDIVGNLIHSENKHLLEIDNTIEEKVVEDTSAEPEIIEEIKEVNEEPIIEEPIIIEKIEGEPIVTSEQKVINKAPTKKAPTKTTKPAVKKAIKKAD